jgi:hypothetical protein
LSGYMNHSSPALSLHYNNLHFFYLLKLSLRRTMEFVSSVLYINRKTRNLSFKSSWVAMMIVGRFQKIMLRLGWARLRALERSKAHSITTYGKFAGLGGYIYYQLSRPSYIQQLVLALLLHFPKTNDIMPWVVAFLPRVRRSFFVSNGLFNHFLFSFDSKLVLRRSMVVALPLSKTPETHAMTLRLCFPRPTKISPCRKPWIGPVNTPPSQYINTPFFLLLHYAAFPFCTPGYQKDMVEVAMTALCARFQNILRSPHVPLQKV